MKWVMIFSDAFIYFIDIALYYAITTFTFLNSYLNPKYAGVVGSIQTILPASSPAARETSRLMFISSKRNISHSQFCNFCDDS